MSGKENPIMGMVLAAKRTMTGFAKKLDDGIIKLVYGVNLPKIENELITLEAQDKKNKEEGISDPTVSKNIGDQKTKILKLAQNPIKNFGIAPLTYQVRRINNFNLCNPLTLGINSAFPPGSPVAEGLRSIQSKLKQIQDIFRNFRIVGRK